MDAASANLSAKDQPAGSCPGCAARDRRIAELEARLAQVEKVLALSQRGSKRQAAPFSKGPPAADPKPPGRKPGDDYGTKAFRAVPPPEVIDQTYDVPLPARCPRCGASGARLVETQIAQQYQVEIPRRPIYRQFNVAVGQCGCCNQRLQGRHELQTSNALGCCASQVGPDAQAAVALLNKEMGLSQGKISAVMEQLFGIKLTPGGACQIMLRTAERCQETYKQIVRHTQAAPVVVPDETGWRIGGRSAWLHVAVTPQAVAYLVHEKRGFEAMALLLGADYAGKMTHDGWAPYNRFWQAIHQTCLGHLLRRCHELLETATRGAVRFPRRVMATLQNALAIRDRREAGDILAATAKRWATTLDQQMERLLLPIKQHAGNERLAEHLWNHRSELFTFLRHDDVDATNYLAEQAIRPAVVNRKVWGGNRTAVGAAAQSILMSVLATARKQERQALDFISLTLRSLPGHRTTLLIASG